MPWLPSDYDDTFWFALTPITSIPLAVYGAAGYVSGDYPLGKPDWKGSARNTALWGGISVAVYAWNAYFHPGKYAYLSGSAAAKAVGHIAAGSAASMAAVGVLVGTPIAMIANRKDPNQGRQLQSAATGQPGIGSYSFF